MVTAGYRAGAAGRAGAERADSVLSLSDTAGRVESGADIAARALDMADTAADTAAIIADPAFGVKVESSVRVFIVFCREFARKCLTLSVQILLDFTILYLSNEKGLFDPTF